MPRNGGSNHVSAHGETSWHGFAQSIVAHTGLETSSAVVGIPTVEYPTPAVRPQFSVLVNDKFGKAFNLTKPK